MTLTLGDRAFETSQTQGTGTIDLDGPVLGYVSFISAVGSGKKVPYIISDNENWETGYGTITSGTPDTLSRDQIRKSSNSNAAVNWGPGTRNVRLGLPADFTPSKDENLNFVEGYGTGGGSANTQTVTLPIVPLAYSDGMEIRYFATVANTGAMTINVNGLGAKSVKINNSNIVGGAIKVGQYVTAVYRASLNAFELTGYAAAQFLNQLPIGSLYLNAIDETNPATFLGYGTWEAYAQGRALVGVGFYTDSNGHSLHPLAGSSFGTYNHQLTVPEMPAHGHESNGTDGIGTSVGGTNDIMASAGTTTTSTTGGTQFHNNTQPSIGIYVWKRVS